MSVRVILCLPLTNHALAEYRELADDKLLDMHLKGTANATRSDKRSHL